MKDNHADKRFPILKKYNDLCKMGAIAEIERIIFYENNYVNIIKEIRDCRFFNQVREDQMGGNEGVHKPDSLRS